MTLVSAVLQTQSRDSDSKLHHFEYSLLVSDEFQNGEKVERICPLILASSCLGCIQSRYHGGGFHFPQGQVFMCTCVIPVLS